MSRVERMCTDDLADGETIFELTQHIRELLAKRAALRQFLSERGRSLVQRGDHVHGTQVLRFLEQIGQPTAPDLRVDPKLVMRVAADLAAQFMRGGG